MTALFLSPSATGHLNATFRLARQLQTDGYRIVYALSGGPELAQSVTGQGFGVHWLQSQPFGIGIDETLNRDRSESYLETLLDRVAGRDLRARTEDLRRTLATVKPTLILIDAFLSTDFVVLYPMLANHPAEVVLVQTMLSTYDDGYTPPLNTALMPGRDSHRAIRQAWQRYYRSRSLNRFFDTIKYLGYSPHRQVRRAFRQNGLPHTYRLREDKVFHAGFGTLPEWLLVPTGFDFADRPLLPHQKPVGLMLDLNRTETLPPAYETLLTRWTTERGQNPALKLIYASLGTVTAVHARERDVLRFWGQLLLATAAQPNWRLMLSVGPDLIDKLPRCPPNAVMFGRVPQLHLLRHADLFVTHGGLNSVLEGQALHVPMLVFPLNRHWDQPGNAARVVARGNGRIERLTKANVSSLTTGITALLTNTKRIQFSQTPVL